MKLEEYIVLIPTVIISIGIGISIGICICTQLNNRIKILKLKKDGKDEKHLYNDGK